LVDYLGGLECSTYLDDILMIKFGSLLLEICATVHLETEEGTHGLLGGIRVLLTFLLLDLFLSDDLWVCSMCDDGLRVGGGL
jgi:hypothetical protein